MHEPGWYKVPAGKERPSGSQWEINLWRDAIEPIDGDDNNLWIIPMRAYSKTLLCQKGIHKDRPGR